MTTPDRRRRRRPDDSPRLLERLFDPDRERPILKAIIAAVAPILIGFLTKQLPIWLAAMRPDDEEEAPTVDP